QKVVGGKVFKTVITKSVRLEESPAYKESIFTFAPDSTGATEYYSLCEEVIDRHETRTSTDHGHAARRALRRRAGRIGRHAGWTEGGDRSDRPQSEPAAPGD